MRHSHTPEGAFTVRLACIRPAASVHPEPGSNSSLYIVVLIFIFCCPGGFTCFVSLLELKGSLPFRLLFIGSLLSKNFAILISVDCGCKSTPFFHTRNTFFEKILNYFLCTEYQYFTEGILEDNAKNRPSKRSLRSPSDAIFRNFYANSTPKTKKVIIF